MAHRTLPMLLLNLAGEMVYILEQRLDAQKVSAEKSEKVLVDICSLILHERFVEELLVPQPLGNVAALRTFFRDLAHSSIMRLDDESMSKMWDLMTMAVKLQAMRADSAGELLQATLNHMSYIEERVPQVGPQARHARQAIATFYGRMSSGELQAVRYCVLNYLQGLAVRVSLYLRAGLQDLHGRILLPRGGPVPPGCESPGTLRVMDGAGREVDTVVHVVHFPAGGLYTGPRDAGPGAGTDLGCNMYHEGDDVGAAAAVAARARRESAADRGGGLHDAQGRPLYVGREELNMLMAQLLGNRPAPRDARDTPHRLISLSLCSGDSGPSQSRASGSRRGSAVASASGRDPDSTGTSAMVNIDASGSAGSRSASLGRVLRDLDAQDGDRESASLLDLWEELEDLPC